MPANPNGDVIQPLDALIQCVAAATATAAPFVRTLPPTAAAVVPALPALFPFVTRFEIDRPERDGQQPNTGSRGSASRYVRGRYGIVTPRAARARRERTRASGSPVRRLGDEDRHAEGADSAARRSYSPLRPRPSARCVYALPPFRA